MRRYLWPIVAGLAVWIPGSLFSAYEFARRVRLTGPGSDSITPFIDSWTQTLEAWLAPAFLMFALVFVLERWLEDRRSSRAVAVTASPAEGISRE